MKEHVFTKAASIAEKIKVSGEKVELLRRNLLSSWEIPSLNRNVAANMTDHTQLSFNADKEDIIRLCKEAADNNFKAVCVNPLWVPLAREIRNELSAKYLVAAVIDFPLGASGLESRVEEASSAVAEGADELDVVISLGTLLSGDVEGTYRNLQPVLQKDAYTKVILEISELPVEKKIEAAIIAVFAGADMLKTSTGVNGKAKIEDVKLLRLVAGSSLGVKAAGGIRSREAFRTMVEAGADRVGCSSSVSIMKEW
ncbi:MAG: deoxyribose-phosphate aldolase [bacterium]